MMLELQTSVAEVEATTTTTTTTNVSALVVSIPEKIGILGADVT